MRNNPIPGREPRELKRERMRELRMREEAELFRQIAAAQEAQRRRSEADARAYDLLLSSLSRGQKLRLKTHGYFIVRGGRTGKPFCITPNGLLYMGDNMKLGTR